MFPCHRKLLYFKDLFPFVEYKGSHQGESCPHQDVNLTAFQRQRRAIFVVNVSSASGAPSL
jgi:hypothetical protein